MQSVLVKAQMMTTEMKMKSECLINRCGNTSIKHYTCPVNNIYRTILSND